MNVFPVKQSFRITICRELPNKYIKKIKYSIKKLYHLSLEYSNHAEQNTDVTTEDNEFAKYRLTL